MGCSGKRCVEATTLKIPRHMNSRPLALHFGRRMKKDAGTEGTTSYRASDTRLSAAVVVLTWSATCRIAPKKEISFGGKQLIPMHHCRDAIGKFHRAKPAIIQAPDETADGHGQAEASSKPESIHFRS